PCAEHVLQALSRHSIAHFACHGVSLTNPADSHLLLLKESILHDLYREEVDKLRVKDIAALKLPKARIAYPSACSTAESTSPRLIDEVTELLSHFWIHLCHWDLMAIRRSGLSEDGGDFYSMLSKTDDILLSYHTAIMGLMKQKLLQLLYWAPFIHFGG
ncbi:hypothetical protein L211DRAFT_780541, partial [Terfezia boudieri ATCC MYA-4762]